jgi:hypothetical protein
MTKYQPERDLPMIAREIRSLSPSKLAQEVLTRRNKEIDPSAITHWFARHPDVEEMLRKELIGQLPDEKQSVDISIFQNGSFDSLQSVKEWITHLRVVRRCKEPYIQAHVRNLRQICNGQLTVRKVNFIAEGKWCLKHPDRLTYNDGKEWLNLIIQKGFDPNQYAQTLKSFLMNKGITEASQFLVGKPQSFGKFKEMYVKEETLDSMLKWILETHGIEAYTIDLLMYKRAYRVNAVVRAKIEDLSPEGKITLYEKGKLNKYGPKGKAVTHALKPYLVDFLRTIAKERITGNFFTLDDDDIGKINMEAIMKFCPSIIAKYGHVNANHFWRHMFGQIKLRKTHWNLALVAKWGNWTPQALEESYGGMPDEIANEQAEEILD